MGPNFSAKRKNAGTQVFHSEVKKKKVGTHFYKIQKNSKTVVKPNVFHEKKVEIQLFHRKRNNIERDRDFMQYQQILYWLQYLEFKHNFLVILIFYHFIYSHLKKRIKVNF